VKREGIEERMEEEEEPGFKEDPMGDTAARDCR